MFCKVNRRKYYSEFNEVMSHKRGILGFFFVENASAKATVTTTAENT
jgi:hypothetical protein